MSIRFEFQVENVETIIWTPSKVLFLADALRKKDSPLIEALELTLFTGGLKVDFQKVFESKSAEKNYG